MSFSEVCPWDLCQMTILCIWHRRKKASIDNQEFLISDFRSAGNFPAWWKYLEKYSSISGILCFCFIYFIHLPCSFSLARSLYLSCMYCVFKIQAHLEATRSRLLYLFRLLVLFFSLYSTPWVRNPRFIYHKTPEWFFYLENLAYLFIHWISYPYIKVWDYKSSQEKKMLSPLSICNKISEIPFFHKP